MKKKFTLFGIAGILALLGATAWLTESSGQGRIWASIVFGLVVLTGAVGSLAIRRSEEKRTNSAAKFSVEVEMAGRAQAGAFRDTLVLGVVLLATILLFELQQFSVFLLVIYLLVVVSDFFIRLLVLTRV